MTRSFLAMCAVLAALALAACTTSQPTVSRNDIDALAQSIQALGSDVDPAEAQRAATIAYSYSQQLARDWNVTDPAIIHNAKVINGFREKGLCNDWAEAMTKRLRQENFQTLDLNWATSPPTPFRIIHHSASISAKGDTMYDGIILDPWRNSGALFWAPVREDTRYNWKPRQEVRAQLLNGSLPY
ncbi:MULTISPECIES: hypothetical protein [unclassified Ruegeria]|uniref:hypothetical protein n=1 Tax=unclassified Ruegeria TaxID=2625375 RepID=UPI001491DE07|nr:MULTISPECIES: hypothetical protein [unclassified Ruegeria]NOC47168.1 hypothetical protein [Ruegeria sp. HKCCD7559]NOD86008.1 hypothetical protein [Ruegeria sp. HKCCD6119]